MVREIVARPFARVFVGCYALLGLFGVLRELLLPESLQAKFNLYRFWLLDWPWHVWVIIALCGCVAVLLEGAYAAVAQRETLVTQAVAEAITGPRPKITITGNLEFIADNVGDTAAYDVRAFVVIPGTNMRLELEPITHVLPGKAAEARFIGYGWLNESRLDSTTIRFFLCKAFLGEVWEWTVGRFRSADVTFDVTYTDFEGRHRYSTPHILRFDPSKVTSEIAVRITRSSMQERPPMLLDAPSQSA